MNAIRKPAELAFADTLSALHQHHVLLNPSWPHIMDNHASTHGPWDWISQALCLYKPLPNFRTMPTWPKTCHTHGRCWCILIFQEIATTESHAFATFANFKRYKSVLQALQTQIARAPLISSDVFFSLGSLQADFGARGHQNIQTKDVWSPCLVFSGSRSLVGVQNGWVYGIAFSSGL